MPFSEAYLNKLVETFKEHGYDINKEQLESKLNLTNVPSDQFMSTVYLRKAEYLSQDYPEKYYCFMCGKAYDTEEEFCACMQDHIIDTMAGTPILRTNDHINWITSQTHPSMQAQTKATLKHEQKRAKKFKSGK